MPRPVADMKPWDIWADLFAKWERVTLSCSRDYVIEWWLTAGDPRPYIDWTINEGHYPSRRVALLVAHMMSRADAPELTPKTSGDVSVGLAVRRSGAGRPRDLEAETVAFLAGRDASASMDAGRIGKVADYEVGRWFEENGLPITEAAVKVARKHWRRRGK